MTYNLNGKNIRIPDDEIEKNSRLLDISKDEAIQMWLEDEGYLENAVVEELTKKAKENRVNHDAKSDKPRKKTERVRKVDEEKKYLLNLLISAINSEKCIDTVKNETEFSFTFGENSYSVKLIKHRPPKKG